MRFGTMLAVCSLALVGASVHAADFRPPAVPLATVDPYMSVWSYTDHLYDNWPVHWTGAVQAMGGMLRVDGKPYRFMGPDALCKQTMEQTRLTVDATQTHYTFTAGGVELALTFTTPMLPEDFALLTAPVTFLTFTVRAVDNAEHDVALYFDASAEWAVNKPNQKVIWRREQGPEGMTLMSFGSQDQPVLEKDGDDLRIDWGYFYVCLPATQGWTGAVASHELARAAFRDSGTVIANDNSRQPRRADDDWPVIAVMTRLDKVGADAQKRHLTLAYDDQYSIEFMHEKLRPWWYKEYNGLFSAMLDAMEKQYPVLLDRCTEFDARLTTDAERMGGKQYAQLLSLAYRQTFASGKVVVGPQGAPWFFHKECFSNGCIDTVDVTYPACPFFALFAPALLRGMLEPVFVFAQGKDWNFDFAPHDVGTYPKANGQRYNPGNIEGQMPVEECGNMILAVAAEARASGNAAFAEKYWALLTQWKDYLVAKGLDPENQLCTDDFAGHLAHNTNLALKAINAIAAYGMLCDMLGKPDGEPCRAKAKEMAVQWANMADDGDHFRLAFDKPGTWSMKYNLVWDKIFGMGIFDPAIAEKEIAYWLTLPNQYGLPLDNRKEYTKADWLVWCATLASNDDTFQKFIAPLYRFCEETPDRCAFTDWYETKTAKCVGFRARPVIGGIFIKMLTDPALWKNYATRADQLQ